MARIHVYDVVILIRLTSLLLFPLSCVQAVDFTPSGNNLACECVSHNARLSIGSKCFAKKNRNFVGRRKVKKHNFIKYIVEACDGISEMPYAHSTKYEDVLKTFYERHTWGNWQVVNGTAQVGDIVLARGKDMFLIESLGKYKVILYNGEKIPKKIGGIENPIWHKINRDYKQIWKDCASRPDDHYINTQNPPTECAQFQWSEPSKMSKLGNYGRVVKAARKEVKAVKMDLNFIRLPMLKVFRFQANIEPTSISSSLWYKRRFQYSDTWNSCYGDQYITAYRNLYVGVNLCNSTRYKIFLAAEVDGIYRNVADGTGYGQDHCELVGGSEVTAFLPNHYAWDKPSDMGYSRNYSGEDFVYGPIGGDRTRPFYGKWYECGVAIPDDIIVET